MCQFSRIATTSCNEFSQPSCPYLLTEFNYLTHNYLLIISEEEKKKESIGSNAKKNNNLKNKINNTKNNALE